MIKKFLLLFLFLVTTTIASPGNVVVIIADDLGIDALSSYNMRTDPITYPYPNTPNINQLVTNGVRFKRAYGYSTCSPTRASFQTGRYGFRTGMGSPTSNYNLPTSEYCIPKILASAPTQYKTALFGKWHLSNPSQNPFTAPNDYGYHYFSGTPQNITDYCSWTKITNGVLVSNTHSQYATKDNVNDAIAWIGNQTTNWFLVVAFNSPHTPLHVPPTGETCVTEYSGTVLQRYHSMVENLDQEIGRLISSINTNNTTVIFLGDNGPASITALAPFNPQKSKGTIYEGGIRVPLIISYNQITNPNRESNSLTNTTDLFSTALDLMGVNEQNTPLLSCLVLDSHSLFPILTNGSYIERPYVISEKFANGKSQDADVCIRDESYKFIRFKEGVEEFYNLENDPFENVNLLQNPLTSEEETKLNYLRTEITNLRATSSSYKCSPPIVSGDLKTRAISFTAPSIETAIQVTMVDLQNVNPPPTPPDFSQFEVNTCTAVGESNSCARWVGPVSVILESQGNPALGSYKAARLQCTPYYYNFGKEGLIHVVGAEIIPSSVYSVKTFPLSCNGNELNCSTDSLPVLLATRRFGDIAPNYNPPSTTQPDALDVVAAVNKFRNAPGSLSKIVVQIQPNVLELNTDVSSLDISMVNSAFSGLPYPFTGPCPCPSTVTCNATACTSSSQCSGGLCIKTCNGGNSSNLPCISNTHCPGGVCGTGFCRDKCGRCSP